MAWTSFAGSRLGSLLFLLLCIATEVQAQTVVARQSVERMMADQFIDEAENQSYLFTLYKNRLNDISSLDMVDIPAGKTWKYSLPEDHYWVGVHHYPDHLGLILLQYALNLDSVYFKELIYQPGLGWKESRVIGALSYNSKNRRPKLRVLESGDWMGIVSEQATYWSKELITLLWKRVGNQLTGMKSMEWKLPLGETATQLERWHLDSQGHFWLMSGNNRQPQPKMDLSQLVKAELIHLNVFEKHVQQWDLILGPRSLREVFYLPTGKSSVRCVGTFSNSGKEEIDGVIVYDLDAEKETVVAQHVVNMEQPTVGVPWIAKTAMTDSTGGFWIWGEEYYYKEVRSMDRINGQPTGPVTVQYQEYFEDIYGWYIGHELKAIDTTVVLPKKQVGADLEGPSFGVSWQDGPVVRFNDHNSSQPEKGEIREWSGQRTVVREYRMQGKNWMSTAKDVSGLSERGNGHVIRMPLEVRDGHVGIFLSGNYFLICTE